MMQIFRKRCWARSWSASGTSASSCGRTTMATGRDRRSSFAVFPRRARLMRAPGATLLPLEHARVSLRWDGPSGIIPLRLVSDPHQGTSSDRSSSWWPSALARAWRGSLAACRCFGSVSEVHRLASHRAVSLCSSVRSTRRAPLARRWPTRSPGITSSRARNLPQFFLRLRLLRRR